jgi:cellobiose phosphorylase
MKKIENDPKVQLKRNSLQRNMFNFLTNKKISCKLIDLVPPTKDETDHIETLIIQGKHKDRNENEFTFQVVLDEVRLKLDTAQPQVTVHFQHCKDQVIKFDVDTNGQLHDVIEKYLYTEKVEKFEIIKAKKETEPAVNA